MKAGIIATLMLFLISVWTVDPAMAAAVKCPSNKARLLVAKSGGDYTTITAALNNSTPTATSPCLIEVWPGTYVENVTMKSYVHLQGSGREVTIIKGTIIVGNPNGPGLTNVAISGFTITAADPGFSNTGIVNYFSSPAIIDNAIVGNQHGIGNASSSPRIIGNTITNNNFPASGIGIENSTLFGTSIPSSPTIIGNTITENATDGIRSFDGASPMIIGNTITGNGERGITNGSSSPIIINNRITGHSVTDIQVDSSSIPNISFNVYDTITGTTGVGQYNVNSNGDPAPAP
ncbi:MAG TPA: pectinesterase family protein [Nitrospiria bacterium]